MASALEADLRRARREFRRGGAARAVVGALDFGDEAVQRGFVRMVLEDPLAAGRAPRRRREARAVVELALARAEAAGGAGGDDLYAKLAELLVPRPTLLEGGLPSEICDEEEEAAYLSYELDAAGARCLSFRVFDRRNEVGLRLWPAATLLAEWALAAPDRWRGKRVLELGAGVGLCGAVLAQHATKVVFTDHEATVLKNLRHVLDVNGLSERENKTTQEQHEEEPPEGGLLLQMVSGPSTTASACCAVEALDWMEPEDLSRVLERNFAVNDDEAMRRLLPNEGGGPRAAAAIVDAVVAADCVYDPEAAAALARVLGRCVHGHGAREVWLANAVRDERTWDACRAAMDRQGLDVNHDEGPSALAAVQAAGGPRLHPPEDWGAFSRQVHQGALRLLRVVPKRSQ